MQKSNIEYLTHHWGFYTGCRHTLAECPCADKCWARSMAHRFGRSFEPTLHPEKLLEPLSLKRPARIGVCFTGDLGGEWVDSAMKVERMLPSDVGVISIALKSWVFITIEQCPQHRFLFLTKNPQGWNRWGKFPDNAYVGFTACTKEQLDRGLETMKSVDAKHKWISFEPLMGQLCIGYTPIWWAEQFKMAGISWVVLGGYSGGKTPPKIEWVTEIVDACGKAGIPYWLKNNLKGLDVSLMVNGLHQGLP